MNNFDVNAFLHDLHKKHFLRNLVFFLLGVLISAFAFNLFYQRYNVVVSGTTGLSVLLSNFLSFDISIIILVLNLCCLMIGLIFFGWEYAVKMLAITFIYPLFVKSSAYLTNFVDLEDTSLFLVMVIGGAMTGYANGLIRNSGYNPGGFYSLYDLMNKYFHISLGTANNVINITLICLGGIFFGLDRALYAIISLLVSSYVVDKITIGISNNKVFYIITERPLDVQEYVNDKLNYDITVVNARGGYSNKKKKMLMAVVPTIEYVKLKEIVHEIDEKAFFLIVDIYEILGIPVQYNKDGS